MGGAFDPPGLPGLTDLLAGLLPEGTESKTSREIAEEVARMGASLSAGATSDYTIVAASALSQFNDQILSLMAEVVLQPSFPENEVELAKQNTKESLRQQRAQPTFLASEMVSRVMFGEPFYFNKSLIIQVPTRIEVRTLQEFRSALSEVEVSAIYFHVFEARHRLKHEESDFSAWIHDGLGMPDLAEKLRAINPYLGSLERVRSALLTVCDEFLNREHRP